MTAQDQALAAALDYIPRWIAHQMRTTEQPGCSFAVARHGKLVAEFALGQSGDGRALTPRHRFRVASHSKTFTAAAVLRLRELGRWQLDDAVGRYVPGLHPRVASATLAQLLSHSAGLVRDGADAAQWSDRAAFLDEAALRADLATGPVITPHTRLKYSNHGYGLLGLAIAGVTGEPYTEWIAREIVAASGLQETTPDMPAVPDLSKPRTRKALPFAQGHSAKWVRAATGTGSATRAASRARCRAPCACRSRGCASAHSPMPPTARTAAWTGRWWSLWGAFDLLPMATKVLVATPSLANPVLDATQIEPSARQPGMGRIALAGSFASHGEAARLELDAKGQAGALWLAATRLQPEPQAAQELAARYQAAPTARSIP